MLNQKYIKKAKTLLEALPYIKKFHGKTVVIKYGGSLMFNDALKPEFARDIVLLKYVGINPVIVHGGGKEISKWLEKVGKKPKFIEGLRVTDEETMEITEMVVSGKINNEVVMLLNQNGGSSIGLSGKDARLFTAKKIKSKKDLDLGFVGDITVMDISLLDTLAQKGLIPVISPVACNDEGESLNLNADHVASELAQALDAMKLIYLTDVDAVKVDGNDLRQIEIKKAKNLLDHPDIKDGMLPKLSCSIDALEGGVSNVHIINGGLENSVILEMFTDAGIGTMFYKEELKKGDGSET
ncbi:acetylglutamate kinase [bacterium]|jgi:acetylglutamate kinase|nr:acetylglutamate kinase [bacterium]